MLTDAAVIRRPPVAELDRARRAVDDMDRSAWAIAMVAYDWRRTPYENWADCIGQMARRGPGTVRGWARTYAWARDWRTQDKFYGLTYSHWEQAERSRKRVDEEELLDILVSAAAERATVEELQAHLILAEQADTDTGRQWRGGIARTVTALRRLTEWAPDTGKVRMIEKLARLLERWAA